jgi:hypothetical protein
MPRSLPVQPDLFGHDQPDLFAAADGAPERLEVPPDFIARIREELEATLAMSKAAERLPWSDFTKSALAEMRFDSLCNWLPAEEAARLREAFFAELDRLYEAG